MAGLVNGGARLEVAGLCVIVLLLVLLILSLWQRHFDVLVYTETSLCSCVFFYRQLPWFFFSPSRLRKPGLSARSGYNAAASDALAAFSRLPQSC